MNSPDIVQQLRDMAGALRRSVLERLPSEAESRFILFLEIQRIFDVRVVQQQLGKRQDGDTSYHDILRWGMNLATSHLLSRLRVMGAIPIVATSPELRKSAENLLYSFGLIALAQRTADMVEHGLLIADQADELITLRDSGTGPAQFMDRVEIDIWNRAEREWTKNERSPSGWAVRNFDDHDSDNLPGAFWSRPEPPPKLPLTTEELEAIARPLIFPWTTPSVTMMGYGARPELDAYFITEASPTMLEFQKHAGIHPQAAFVGFTGDDLLVLTTLMVSFFRKHVYFGLLARKHVPQISFTESLTIWGPLATLVETLCDASSLEEKTVIAVLSALTVTPEDADAIGRESTPLLPMLIDLGNGLVLRPVSSLARNPLSGFHTIAQWRSPSARNAACSAREAWFRGEIYSVFGGRRYQCVDSNIVLRRDGKRLTDIDAAVFDRTNGELALIQLKWQDYSTSAIRELRSKAKNFSSEVDAWAGAVVDWMSALTMEEIAQALRLRLVAGQRVMSIYLFVVSRHVARTHGFGFPISSPYLSLATWPQFKRVRCQIGPAPLVISHMHEVLRAEEQLVLSNTQPSAVDVHFPGLRLHYVDLWNKWDGPSEKDDNPATDDAI